MNNLSGSSKIENTQTLHLVENCYEILFGNVGTLNIQQVGKYDN